MFNRLGKTHDHGASTPSHIRIQLKMDRCEYHTARWKSMYLSKQPAGMKLTSMSGEQTLTEATITGSTGEKRTITWLTLGQLYHGLYKAYWTIFSNLLTEIHIFVYLEKYYTRRTKIWKSRSLVGAWIEINPARQKWSNGESLPCGSVDWNNISVHFAP